MTSARMRRSKPTAKDAPTMTNDAAHPPPSTLTLPMHDIAAHVLAQEPAPSNAMAPMLQQLIKQYAATGLPAPYLPKDELSTTTQPPTHPA